MKHENISVVQAERYELAAEISHVSLELTNSTRPAGQFSQQGSMSFGFEKITNEN